MLLLILIVKIKVKLVLSTDSRPKVGHDLIAPVGLHKCLINTNTIHNNGSTYTTTTTTTNNDDYDKSLTNKPQEEAQL